MSSCHDSASPREKDSYQSDSLKVLRLLEKGDSLYSLRASMKGIGESLLYFDSANRLAQRINDTLLLANSNYYIGNVYNAWNGEPQKTIDYYTRSASLYASLPGNTVREYYLRYIIAHGYDGEKMNDSIRCINTILSAFHDLKNVPEAIKDSMDFLSDFAWVATNVRNYELAESIINSLPGRPQNNPKTNNYLDHYYLTKARIDVYHYKRASSFLDSLASALEKCNNRFDSAYYSINLADLNARLKNYEAAYFYSYLNNRISNSLSTSDILTSLRTELLHRELDAEKEKEKRNQEEIKIRTLYLSIAILAAFILLLGGFIVVMYQKRRHAQARAEQQEQFTMLLLQKEEDERKRVAMELHDGINHDLLALKHAVLLGKPVQTQDIEMIIDSIRKMSRNLYPALVESVGLGASVESLCNMMTEAGFFTTCHIEYANELQKWEEVQVYRIIQEGLQNFAKHAKANACRILLVVNTQSLLLEVRDNGTGFDIKQTKSGSFGMQTMTQRAKAIGAQIQFESSPAGTIITVKKVFT